MSPGSGADAVFSSGSPCYPPFVGQSLLSGYCVSRMAEPLDAVNFDIEPEETRALGRSPVWVHDLRLDPQSQGSAVHREDHRT